MKKMLCLLLVAVMCISLVACDTETKTAKTEETAKTYVIGESVETEDFIFTPELQGFFEELSNVGDSRLTPGGYKTSGNPYRAEVGKTMMLLYCTLEYIGESKKDETIGVSASIDFDNGYIFDGDKISFVTEGGYYGFYSGDGNIECIFEPLSSDTKRIIRVASKVPEQVKNDEDKPLSITFKIEDKEYIYKIR